jgi:hypothetical protein
MKQTTKPKPKAPSKAGIPEWPELARKLAIASLDRDQFLLRLAIESEAASDSLLRIEEKLTEIAAALGRLEQRP